MLARLIGWIGRWLVDWYTDWIVCKVVCCFGARGSNFEHIMVHFLVDNVDDVVAVGIDFKSKSPAARNVVLYRNGQCLVSGDPIYSHKDLSELRAKTAYAKHCEEEVCPLGFRRLRCDCAKEGENVEGTDCICYTTDPHRWTSWEYEKEFPDNIGQFLSPSKDGPPTNNSIPCGSTYILHAVGTHYPDSCDGFSGPQASENEAVRRARVTLKIEYDNFKCVGSCQKSSSEIFRGWHCGVEDGTGRIKARAVVQWLIACS